MRKLDKLSRSDPSRRVERREAFNVATSCQLVGFVYGRKDPHITIIKRLLPGDEAHKLAACGYERRSNSVAIPCPPPMHIVANPYRACRVAIAWISVVAIRAPDAPSGWPIAIAPPFTFTRSGS